MTEEHKNKIRAALMGNKNGCEGKEPLPPEERKRRDKLAAQRWRDNNRKRLSQHYREYHIQLKLDVMAHYGPGGALKCSWPGCEINDVDMLSLDHINNDGAEDRRKYTSGRGGVALYRRLRNTGYPTGMFQTLCWNHQWKKEIMRLRSVA